MTLAVLFWLFALALTVHNIEEGLFLPAYAEAVPRVAAWVTPFSFRFALIVLTGATYVVVVLAITGDALAMHVLAGLAAAMAINAVIPHLTLTLALRRYAAGTATALFVVLPVSVLLIANSLAADLLSLRALVVAAVAVAVVLVLSIPLLFWTGRWLERHLAVPAI